MIFIFDWFIFFLISFTSIWKQKKWLSCYEDFFSLRYIAVLWRLKTNKNNQAKKKEELIDRLKHFHYIHFYRCTHESNKIVLLLCCMIESRAFFVFSLSCWQIEWLAKLLAIVFIVYSYRLRSWLKQSILQAVNYSTRSV